MKRNNYHLRDLPSIPFDEDRERPAPEFREFVIEEIIPTLGILDGRYREEKTNTAIQVLLHLVLAGQRCRTVADTRDNSVSGVKRRVKIWNAVVGAKLARCCVGSEESRLTTRYY